MRSRHGAAVLLLAFFAAAAFFQASELAIVALNRVRIRHFLRAGHPRAPAMDRVARNPEAYLTVTLVGTNIAVIGASSVATYLAESQLAPGFRPLFLLAETLLLAVLILPIPSQDVAAPDPPRLGGAETYQCMLLGIASGLMFASGNLPGLLVSMITADRMGCI